mmetsp:Transcript_53739/g.130106  ORF Transcript_53739/g.130106 Transcript_53739/m.130106 type:complete len:206 (-) Transcript_53739:645-1262(-)
MWHGTPACLSDRGMGPDWTASAKDIVIVACVTHTWLATAWSFLFSTVHVPSLSHLWNPVLSPTSSRNRQAYREPLSATILSRQVLTRPSTPRLTLDATSEMALTSVLRESAAVASARLRSWRTSLQCAALTRLVTYFSSPLVKTPLSALTHTRQPMTFFLSSNTGTNMAQSHHRPPPAPSVASPFSSSSNSSLSLPPSLLPLKLP